MTGNRPLSGVRVADFGQFIAGPGVGMLLAELGAQVIKVEPVTGEPARAAGRYGSAMVLTNNRDKLGLAVDLATGAGREIARRLVVTSDVLVQNMRPGVMDRLGLGVEDVQRANPSIVYLSITGYGADAGPDRPGFDIAAQAESGMMSVTGEPDRDPQRVGFTVVDSATAYAATNAVLAALFRRQRTGDGAVIDTSLLEVAIHLQGPNWVQYFATGEQPTRTGNGQPLLAPAAEVIEVADGQLVLSAYTAAHWARLCATLGRPELVDDPRFADNDARVVHRAEMDAIITAALGGLTVTEAVRRLGAAGIVVGAIRGYAQVAGGEDAARLGAFPTATGGGTGTYRHAAAPYSFRDLPRGTGRSAPAVGEHSRVVLRQLGFGDAEIDDYAATGVILDASRG